MFCLTAGPELMFCLTAGPELMFCLTAGPEFAPCDLDRAMNAVQRFAGRAGLTHIELVLMVQ
jgi:hypothetical protein